MTTPSTDPVTEFGRAIFADLPREQPTPFHKNFWISKTMHWTMSRPELKTDLFRLVDVLPNLHSSASVAAHITEYLQKPVSQIHPLLGMLLRFPPHSLLGTIAAFCVRLSVKEMASLFIAGATPEAALPQLHRLRRTGLAFTVDLLGEFCVSEREAIIYQNRYLKALEVFAAQVPQWHESKPIIPGHPGESSPLCISVKLTALYSQCSPLNFSHTVAVLSERLSTIVREAKKVGALLYVDAEDTANNPMIYETFKQVFSSAEFKDLPYPGIVLQCYCKEAPRTLEMLVQFARTRGTPIAIRLVKGAYWDYETVVSEQQGLDSPLLRYKVSSDAQFEALTRVAMDNHEVILPAIASHNIRSLSHACVYAEQRGLTPKQFELQTLYGMADAISHSYRKRGYLVRQYTPLGDLYVGMGYLVRRLLENSSNESFLRHTFFDKKEIDTLLATPLLHPNEIAV